MPFALESPQIAEEDYAFLRQLIYEQSRIHLGREKKGLVTSRLAKRLRELRLAGYGEYCDLLRSPGGSEELRNLIDRISTNHTSFFREPKHFDFLRDTVLPQWRRDFATGNCNSNGFYVWSAACSSGEEPCSLAILLAEHLSQHGLVSWQIEASDISTRVLNLARRAVYDSERVAAVHPELLRKYFQKGIGDWEGHFRVKEELRPHIRFHHLNLLQPPYPFTRLFDVIFCRNVMIYFDRPTQEALVRHLSDRLAPGGYLMVGHSESLSGIQHGLQLVHPATYRKTDG